MLLFLLACASSEEPERFYAPDAAGPYRVGVTTLESEDAGGMRTEIWYPTEADGDPDPYLEIPLPGTAQRDVEPLEGDWPVLAFSHGNSGIRYQSYFLTERLASFGFLVVAPDHFQNTLFDLDDDAAFDVANRRPVEVSTAVDRLLEWAARPLDTPYGVIGHSFGAWTALVVGGGELDWAYMVDACKADDGLVFCGILDEGLDASVTPPAPDPRAVATVALAPGGSYTFGADAHGLATVNKPLLIGGTLDDTTPMESEVDPIYARVGSPRGLAAETGAGHFSFTNICEIGLEIPECAGAADGYMDIEVAHAVTNALVVSWLEVQMLGDARYEAWLDQGTLQELGDTTFTQD